MTRRRKFTDAQEQEICRRYLQGESAVQLAGAHKVSNGTIGYILNKWKIKKRTYSEAKGGLPKDREIEVCALYVAGKTMDEIAAELPVSPATIDRILIRNGVPKRSNSEAQQNSLTKQQELELCNRYQNWEGIDGLAKKFGIGRKRALQVLKDNGIKQRPTLARRRIFSEAQAQEICERYLKGEHTTQLGIVYGVSFMAIRNVLIRNDIERRARGSTGDSVQHILDCTGRHEQERSCHFYLFALARYSKTHCKPGITVDFEDRIRTSKGEYGENYLCKTFATRREAFFVEQALLHLTRDAAQCPRDLWDWAGTYEVRAMPAAEVLLLAEQLLDEMEELGAWDFAALRVPMTAAQRAICQQRALEGAANIAA
jgi:DNA-binding CsgD family transcriptional regulator